MRQHRLNCLSTVLRPIELICELGNNMLKNVFKFCYSEGFMKPDVANARQ